MTAWAQLVFLMIKSNITLALPLTLHVWFSKEKSTFIFPTSLQGVTLSNQTACVCVRVFAHEYELISVAKVTTAEYKLSSG